MLQFNQQGRMANLKSILIPDMVVGYITDKWPNATVVWARHGGHACQHFHYVVRWPSVVRWGCLAKWLHDHDGHEYAKAAGSWRRSVRYLLHLDNPEKEQIPRDALGSENIDEDELSQLLGSQALPILESLILASSRPLAERFAYLVMERGHRPSEISAALRCMMDLERWEMSRTQVGLRSALPSDVPGSRGAEGDADGTGLVVDLDDDSILDDPAMEGACDF